MSTATLIDSLNPDLPFKAASFPLPVRSKGQRYDTVLPRFAMVYLGADGRAYLAHSDVLLGDVAEVGRCTRTNPMTWVRHEARCLIVTTAEGVKLPFTQLVGSGYVLVHAPHWFAVKADGQRPTKAELKGYPWYVAAQSR